MSAEQQQQQQQTEIATESATQQSPTNELNLEDSQLQQVIAQAAAIMGDYSQLLASMDVGKFAHTPLVPKANPVVLPDADTYKKLLITQKVRQDNRERKKRWRERNQERNKDNDLRCRVNKRAQKLFGKEDSEHKKKWIDEEFARRREKRLDKEQRKTKTLTPPASPSTPLKTDEEMAAFTNLLNDQNYISILADNLNSLAGDNNNKPNQLTAQLLEFLQQQQQQQQQGTVVDQQGSNGKQEESERQENKAGDYPMEVVLTLMQMNAGWRQ
ncbi:hypothetical protein G6F57_004604 [Rhizopus arrhizus]|jgi:hypothetical protein|uniref:DUF3020 domain-containing protein n=1 Tax=Rhizopus oryzae TaxID=64495 RepID=A0A9P7BUD8_RHIOR|nr:hypothetical protein G6F23_002004 [Rhizopus arrhizus]KAG1419279.1 hypothetical protein G6F58_004687 [Rhizopus delemar]KAG0761659.1 hypothetical protein G6F24_007395 [Rhizopus arrhizus]KAG0794032.1 hypothetical protein G6F21_003174 [Rhizopus arrhizus]KAG0798416.1 hypothetical protein G6F22_004243 [Rhizopus arrhizus]